VGLIVLGSGGPDFADGRAGAGYVVQLDDRPRLIVDAGPGTAARFHREGLAFEHVSALLVTHLHVDHVGDLVAYLKSAWFGPRADALPIHGPPAGERMPSIEGFVHGLIGTPGRSPFGYLAGYLDASDGFSFAVAPHTVEAAEPVWLAGLPDDLRVSGGRGPRTEPGAGVAGGSGGLHDRLQRGHRRYRRRTGHTGAQR